MSVIHILNIADWALVAAGLAAALLMMIIGADGEPHSTRKGPKERRRFTDR
jgi:hypothetical protein